MSVSIYITPTPGSSLISLPSLPQSSPPTPPSYWLYFSTEPTLPPAHLVLPSTTTLTTLYNLLYRTLLLLPTSPLSIYTTTDILLPADSTPLSALLADYASAADAERVELCYDLGVRGRTVEVHEGIAGEGGDLPGGKMGVRARRRRSWMGR